MAGDIGIKERAIVLEPGRRFAPAALEGASRPQGVAHIYGSRVLIVEQPRDAAEAIPGALAEEAAESPSSLSFAESLGLDAFHLRESRDYNVAKAERPYQGSAWDSGDATTPACQAVLEESTAEEGFAPAAMAPPPPTSAAFTGSVALGIIIVEGTAPGLAFTEQERVKVVAEVQNGLGWLASQNPAGVTFLYDIHNVVLSVAPGPSTLTLAQKETRWRDPAMSSLGFGSGMAGVTTYVLNLRASLGTQWAYCAFFTKYPVGHFAYASLGGPRLVMHYENDNWGPDNIDRVFAHESGHIFGAPDEYASSGCNCGGSFGIFGVPNGNCANCAPGGGVDCLMKQNSWALCSFTPAHLGFPAADPSGSPIS